MLPVVQACPMETELDTGRIFCAFVLAAGSFWVGRTEWKRRQRERAFQRELESLRNQYLQENRDLRNSVDWNYLTDLGGKTGVLEGNLSVAQRILEDLEQETKNLSLRIKSLESRIESLESSKKAWSFFT